MRDWVRLRDVPLSTECDDQPSGDDRQPRVDTTPTPDASTQTLTKVGHVE